MRIVVISEEIAARPAEGLLVFLMHMCSYLAGRHELLVLHGSGETSPEIDARRVLGGRLLLTRKSNSVLKDWNPDVVLYTPAKGLTGTAMLGSVLLRRITGRPVIVVVLHTWPTGRLHRAISVWSAPELVLSPALEMRQSLEELRINTDFIMPGYDPLLFKPSVADRKRDLRVKHGLPLDRFIVLHVGHIRERANMQALLRYREWGADVQPVVKAVDIEPVWRDHLRRAGVIVMEEYTDAINEIYQAADLYLFPASDRDGGVEFPLSVIEACACNLPVLTTRSGILPEILDAGEGLEWYSSVAEIPYKIGRLRGGAAATRLKVEGLSWERIFERYLAPHLESLGSMPR